MPSRSTSRFLGAAHPRRRHAVSDDVLGRLPARGPPDQPHRGYRRHCGGRVVARRRSRTGRTTRSRDGSLPERTRLVGSGGLHRTTPPGRGGRHDGSGPEMPPRPLRRSRCRKRQPGGGMGGRGDRAARLRHPVRHGRRRGSRVESGLARAGPLRLSPRRRSRRQFGRPCGPGAPDSGRARRGTGPNPA